MNYLAEVSHNLTFKVQFLQLGRLTMRLLKVPFLQLRCLTRRTLQTNSVQKVKIMCPSPTHSNSSLCMSPITTETMYIYLSLYISFRSTCSWHVTIILQLLLIFKYIMRFENSSFGVSLPSVPAFYVEIKVYQINRTLTHCYQRIYKQLGWNLLTAFKVNKEETRQEVVVLQNTLKIAYI